MTVSMVFQSYTEANIYVAASSIAGNLLQLELDEEEEGVECELHSLF